MPNLTPADLFFLHSVKEELAGLSLAAIGAKKALDGVSIPMYNIEFATAFRLVVPAV